MTLLETFDLALESCLYDPTFNVRGEAYICIAVLLAGEKKEIDRVKALLLRDLVRDSLTTVSLATDLAKQGRFPESAVVTHSGNGLTGKSYNLKHPDYLVLRNEFIEKIRSQLAKEGV